MIGFPILIALLLLFVPIWNHKGERAASRRPWAIAVVCLSVIMIGGLWWEGQQSPWSPNFNAQPLSEKVVGATSGLIFTGRQCSRQRMFELPPHSGFRRPARSRLTYIADKLTRDNLVIRILDGGGNMPASAVHSNRASSMRWSPSWNTQTPLRRKIKRTTPLHLLHPHLNESAQSSLLSNASLTEIRMWTTTFRPFARCGSRSLCSLGSLTTLLLILLINLCARDRRGSLAGPSEAANQSTGKLYGTLIAAHGSRLLPLQQRWIISMRRCRCENHNIL